MRELEAISTELFDKIRTRFSSINLGDEKAKATSDPEKARYFNFDFEVDGERLGNITISLIDESGMKIYFSKDMVDALKVSQAGKEEKVWYEFLRNLRMFAKRNQLTFDTRDITKSNLDLRDIQQSSETGGMLSKDDLHVSESRTYGTSRSSYRECGPTRIIIRHSDNIDEEKHGARSRNIESVFVETHLGERFLLPEKNLHYAQAMARHVSEGGRLDDELGESITSMCREMKHMSHFVRRVKNRQFEDTETTDMAEAATAHYGELKNQLKQIGGRRGYSKFKETFAPANDVEEDVDVASLRERFVKKVYDEKFDEALPYVERAYRRQKSLKETPMAEEFSSWANEIAEGTWDEPDDEHDMQDLDVIMSNPLEVGINGNNAIGVLQNIIGDDELSEQFAELAQTDEKKEHADARPLVIAWLNKHNPELAAKYNTNYDRPDSEEQSDGETYGNDMNRTYATPPHSESADPLSFIRHLAGLNK